MISQTRVADRYEIEELLGQGGMGLVYRALDAKTKSHVALKTMRDASDTTAVEMFEKEWALLAGLSHPNIVDIRDVGEIEENGQKKPFFVMPLLRGATLAKLIEDSSARLTVERIVGIISQVCRGLHAAHDHGLIHRDIKPSNIFVMEDDTAKIIDFGVVHLTGSHSVTGHKGTWQYMAPEQVDLKPATPASDLFSIGVVCYESLTGKKPFARPTPMETAEAIRKYIPPPASELNPAVSQILSMVVHKAMAKEPIYRFVNARELGETLQKAFLNQPIERFDPARIQPRIERAKKALAEGDEGFAAEILNGLEAEGNIGLEITLLRGQIEQRTKQKRTRQLLESARTRLEQDEIPLALEKIQEILSIDAENSDALALRSTIEKRRNERQIESWMELARKHLDRHDFTEARQALREVLRVRPSDTLAGDLLADTDRREQQSLRIRTEREQLYGSAMRSYQNGELSSALSKLERILELGSQTPDAALPDRDATYQMFYNQVRTERDAIQNAYESVRRQLADKAFARALEICEEFSAKYPNDALFQALKLEAVEQQRQEQSAYLAEVGRRVDTEPDLDRKVNILKEACERYPTEPQFQQLLKITRDRRDLACSIVSKARQYEERNQFAEAVGQWDILRNLYPRYPGIDIEIAQLTQRREAQARDESKARLVDVIDRALDSSDFGRALDLATGAIYENPQDPEFAGLARRAREGLDRSSQARSLLVQGQQLLENSQFEEAIEVLHRASACDPKSTLIRDTLLRALLERARPLVDQDWRMAEPLVQQACELDPSHPGARSLRVLVTDAKRKEYVPQCLAEARDLQEAGNASAALEKIETALSQYPNDARLLQLHSTLQGSVRDLDQQKVRHQDVETLHQIRRDAETAELPDEWKSILERSQSIWVKYPDDPEVGAVASEIKQKAGATTPDVDPGPSAPAEPATPKEKAKRKSLKDSFLSPILGAVQKVSAGLARVRLPRPRKHAGSQVKSALLLRSPWSGPLVIVLIAGIAIVAALLRSRSTVKPPPPRPRFTTVRVHLNVKPADAIVMVEGARASSGELDLDPRISYEVKVTRLGFEDRMLSLTPSPEWNLSLEPAQVRVNIEVGDKPGEVLIDDRKVGDVTDGIAQDLPVPADGTDHVLKVRNGSTDVVSLRFATEAGREPVIKGLETRDLQAITSLGPGATLYNSTQGLKANLAGQPFQPIPPEGLKLALTDANHEIAFDNKDLANRPVAIEHFPALTVALHPQPRATVKIACDVAGAQLFIDKRDAKWKCRDGFWTVIRAPGDHSVRIVADGYKEYTDKITLKDGENPSYSPKLERSVTTGSLDIRGGTPEAEVYVEGESKGKLDENGSRTIEGIQPGERQIRLHRENFEDYVQNMEFTVGQTLTFPADRAKLRQFGSLVFDVTPSNAIISYSRPGEQPKTTGNGTVHLRAGRYRVTVALGGYQSRESDPEVEPGKEVLVRWTLVPTPINIPVQPTHRVELINDVDAFDENSRKLLTTDTSWLVLKGSAYAFLKPGFQKVTIVFRSLGKESFPLRKKHLVWTAHYVDSGNRVEYDFDGTEVNRRVFADQAENKKAHDHFKLPLATTYTIVMEVQKDRILILDEKGNALDQLVLDGQDLSKGRIGLKGSIDYFTVHAQ